MGRHKSSLRELGWAASNSPNPWKHGSAKRVVRTLDYSNIECEAPKENIAEPVRASLLSRTRRRGDYLIRKFDQAKLWPIARRASRKDSRNVLS